MALVEVTGFVRDHSRVAFDRALQPKLVFRPDRSRPVVEYLMSSVESEAEWTSPLNGTFRVLLENGGEYASDIRYTPVLSWLMPDARSAPENWAREYEEWPSFSPGLGGAIGDLMIEQWSGDSVWTSPTAVDSSKRTAFQLNTTTWELYERTVTY